MAGPSVPQLAGLTALVSLGYVVFGVVLHRRYSGIGVRSLSAFAIVWGCNFLLNSLVVAIIAAYGVTSGANIGDLNVPRNVELFLVSSTPVTELLTVAAIFGWLWFVLNYTTRLDRQDRLGIIAIGIVVFALTTLNGLIGALSSVGYLQIAPGVRANFHQFAGIVEIVGTGVAVGSGIAQLYAASHRHPPFTRGAVLGLTVPVLFPYLIRYTYQFGLVVEFRAIELLRIVGLLIGLVGLWAAVYRYRIFDQLPASKAVGRETAFDTTETPIVLLDDKNTIADINDAAGTLFDVSLTDVIGDPLADLLPAPVDTAAVREPGRTTFQFPTSDRIVEAETAVTTDDQGREIGRTIVYNDITEERRRQQRIQVLNRVLRHNLRNDLNVASGYVEMLTDEGVSPETYTPEIQAILNELVEMGGKARSIEEMLATDVIVETPRSLSRIVEESIDRVRGGRDSVPIRTDIPEDLTVSINPHILRRVLEELLENAVEHTDGADVEVRVSDDADGLTLVVSDTGPGIAEYELDVFQNEHETALEHGSGLGLWIVKWGVDRFGGTLSFETDDAGTRVSISIPGQFIERSGDALVERE